MSWIKMETHLPEKPEVYRLAKHLGIHRDQVIGALLRFWRWCDKICHEKDVLTVTLGPLQDDDIDATVGYPGFAVGMLEVGWIKRYGDEVRIPNFRRHNSKTARERALCAERVRRHRSLRVTPSPLPEKRREEKRTSKDDSIESSSSSGKPDSVIDFDFIVKWWNEIAPQIPAHPIRFLSETRKQHVRCRLREHPDALAEIEARIKALGTFGRKGWLQFSWIFKSPENLIKLLEGNYDNEGLHRRDTSEQQTEQEKNALAEYMRNLESSKGADQGAGAPTGRVLPGSSDGIPMEDHDLGTAPGHGPVSLYAAGDSDVPF